MATISEKLTSTFSFFASRYAPAFITLLVLAGGFYFYFSVIVSKNEADIKERSFRGLHRMATNIAGKIDDYAERNAANFLKAMAQSKSDSASLAQLKSDYDLENRVENSPGSDTFSVKLLNEWKLRFKGNNDSVAYASAKKFTSSLLRRDLFPYYLLAKGDTVLFDELNISNNKISEFLPGDYGRDSIKKGQIQSGEIREVNIGGRDYKLFMLSFISEGKNKFKIGGYMPVENYVGEQRYIPPYALLWMFIGLMAVVLMFPLLKVFLMHRSEQLLVSNAITSLASLHVISAIIVLAAINSYVYFNVVLSTSDKNLKAIATDTESNFTGELDAALSEIDSIKTMVAKKPLPDKPFIHLLHLRDTGNKLKTTSPNFRVDSTSYEPGSRYPYFKHIAWVDSAGEQRYRWTTNSYVMQTTNVSERDYFKAVRNDSLWLRNGKPYYFTGVSSWLSNEKIAVVAAPFKSDSSRPDTKGLMMVSISGAFRSMFRAVLPAGYGFCIVKNNGDVLFHMDESRSLNENLVEESTDNETLQALLHAGLSGFTASKYSGRTQRFYVKPIPGMPYSVVSFRDMRTIWSEDLDVISVCSILCLMNLAVILLAILIIQASGYRHSLLQSQSLLFTWLRPNKKLKEAYRSVSMFYWFSMALQSLFFVFYDARDQLCLIGVSFSYSYILLSYAYLQFAVLNEDNEGRKQQNKKSIYILSAFYGFIILIFTINLDSGRFLFLGSQLLLVFLAWLFTKPAYTINGLMKHKSFRWWYGLSVFSFMAATSITPLLNFYFLSFKEERLLSLKQSQLEFASQFAQVGRDAHIVPADSIRFSYAEPFYFKNFADKVSVLPLQPVPLDTLQNNFEFLYKKIKPTFSDHSRELGFSIRKKDAGMSDFRWVYNPDSGRLQLVYPIQKTERYFNNPGILISSTLKYDIQHTEAEIKADWLSFLLLIGVLLLFLWGFNFLLSMLIQKIFFEGYDNSSRLSESDLSYIGSLPDDENIFVVGTINSGKNRMLMQYLLSKKVKVEEIDMAALSTEKAEDLVTKLQQQETGQVGDKPASAKTVILLRHFELFMSDLTVTEKKLRLLELLLSQKKQIIILSSRSLYSMSITNGKAGVEAVNFTDRWSNVMNQFYTLYHRWEHPDEDKDRLIKEESEKELYEAGKEKIEKLFQRRTFSLPKIYRQRKQLRKKSHQSEAPQTNLEQIVAYFEWQLSHFFTKLNKECSHSDFLWSLRPTLFSYIKKHKKELLDFEFLNKGPEHVCKIINRQFIMSYEQLCLKIQSLAASYYLAVWQSLNRDEQRTLYDIAQDDMVNPGNRDIASRLADLGLVKRIPDIACYEVMNTSFRNFIFTQLDKNAVKSLSADADEQGSWNSFQLPVWIVVLSIGAFLFTTQKDAFTNLIAYLGAAAGGIAALLKVLGMIPSNKN